MHILRTFEELTTIHEPVCLTIGNFDGVHQGHQAVLKALKQKKMDLGGVTVVISFSNHPANVLRSEPIKLLTTLSHRIKLLKEQKVDRLVLIPFTKELSQETAEDFIGKILSRCNLKALVLGLGATLGKEKKGGQRELKILAKRNGFDLQYITPLVIEGKQVSSSFIRRQIEAGHLIQAEPLLGRPYSLYQIVQKGIGFAKKLNYPTLNFSVDHLCIPPLGVYVVEVIQGTTSYPAVANLGVAPTVRLDNHPLLEVYLLEGEDKTRGDLPYEVIYRQYIRPEKKFDTLEALKEQIGQDVDFANNYFKNT